MVDPVLYSQGQGLVKYDANYFLETYGKLLNWQRNENVLDVGVAEGGVTFNCLLPKIPKDFQKLIGVDINNEMVQMSKRKPQNSKIDFLVMDICTRVIPSDFQETFHHIFGFNVIHWVQDQRSLFRNMYKMLKPGGEIFLTSMLKIPVTEAEEVMSTKEKWTPYTQNYKDYISVYYYSDDPVKDVKKYLENEGFTCILCQLDKRSYTFTDLNVYRNLMCSVNPYCQQISEDKRDDYIDEYLKTLECLDGIKIYDSSDGGQKQLDYNYTSMIIIASKPFSKN